MKLYLKGTIVIQLSSYLNFLQNRKPEMKKFKEKIKTKNSFLDPLLEKQI